MLYLHTQYSACFLPFLSALFCDYYNPDGECEWHYAACGKSCMKTCRNPSGKCYNNLPSLEGKNDKREKKTFKHLKFLAEKWQMSI